MNKEQLQNYPMIDVLEGYENHIKRLTQCFIKLYFEEDYDIDQIQELYVGQELGGMFEINDRFFHFSDAYYCLKHHVDSDVLLEWYDYNLLWHPYQHYINLNSWVKGCPRRSDEEFNSIYEAQKRVDAAKEELERLIKENKIIVERK
jgi:hypothetical protein